MRRVEREAGRGEEAGGRAVAKPAEPAERRRGQGEAGQRQQTQRQLLGEAEKLPGAERRGQSHRESRRVAGRRLAAESVKPSPLEQGERHRAVELGVVGAVVAAGRRRQESEEKERRQASRKGPPPADPRRASRRRPAPSSGQLRQSQGFGRQLLAGAAVRGGGHHLDDAGPASRCRPGSPR